MKGSTCNLKKSPHSSISLSLSNQARISSLRQRYFIYLEYPLYWVDPLNPKYNGKLHEYLWLDLRLIVGKEKVQIICVNIFEDSQRDHAPERYPVVGTNNLPPIVACLHGHIVSPCVWRDYRISPSVFWTNIRKWCYLPI